MIYARPSAFGFVGKPVAEHGQEATEAQTEYLQDMLGRAFEGRTIAAQKALRMATQFDGQTARLCWFYDAPGVSWQIEFLSTDGPHVEALRIACSRLEEGQ